MADYEDSDLTGAQPVAAPSPVLQEYREAFDQPGVAPAARDLAYDQTTLINDYQQRRRIADEVVAADQEFVAGIDTFKSGMVSMVQNDPQAIDLGLNLAELTIDGMVSSLTVADGATHRDALIRHTQSEIAAAAITAAAEQDEGLARGMLAHPRVTGLLGEATGPLDTYITLQAQARAVDHDAEMEISQRRASEAVDRSAINYLGALHDPTTDGVQFPPGWNQAILADNSLPPAVKVAVAGIYNRLRTEGDAPASDPFLVSHLVSRIASNDPPPVAEMVQLMGRGLTVADAMLLLGGAGPTTVQSRRGYTALANTLDAAREALAPPENGPAGEAAFSRFTNWLMPAYRNSGPASLSAASDNFLLASNPIQAFAPSPSDFADAAIADPGDYGGGADAEARRATGPINRSRPSLDKIFRGRQPNMVPDEAAIANARASVGGKDDDDIPQPLQTGPKGPFFEVQRPNQSQRIGGGAQNIVAGDPEPTEMLTDTGTKQMTAADLAQSSTGPRPLVTENQQRAFDGMPPLGGKKRSARRRR